MDNRVEEYFADTYKYELPVDQRAFYFKTRAYLMLLLDIWSMSEFTKDIPLEQATCRYMSYMHLPRVERARIVTYETIGGPEEERVRQHLIELGFISLRSDDSGSYIVISKIITEGRDMLDLLELKNRLNHDSDKYTKDVVAVAAYAGGFKTICRNSKEIDILQLRAEGKTLAAIAENYGVTRERIRQILVKITKKFKNYLETECPYIYILENSMTVYMMDNNVISRVYGRDSTYFKFALKVFLEDYPDRLDILYCEEIDGFVKPSFYEIIKRADRQLEELPDVIPVDQSDIYLDKIYDSTDHLLPKEIIKEFTLSKYYLYGKSYIKTKQYKRDLYHVIIEKFYPNGIEVFNKAVLAQFRAHFEEMFFDIKDITDKAISTRICAGMILCGRGKYILPKYMPYDKEVIEKVFDYFINSHKTTIFYHELFATFRNELVKSGIRDRYCLQGALTELHSEDYLYFSKDAISKQKPKRDVISTFVDEYAMSHDGIISLENIKGAFPLMPDNIIIQRMQYNPKYIYYSVKTFINVDVLKYNDEDAENLRKQIDTCLNSGLTAAKDIYNYILENDSRTVDKVKILNSHMFLGFIKYLFPNMYVFGRSSIRGYAKE